MEGGAKVVSNKGQPRLSLKSHAERVAVGSEIVLRGSKSSAKSRQAKESKVTKGVREVQDGNLTQGPLTEGREQKKSWRIEILLKCIKEKR